MPSPAIRCTCPQCGVRLGITDRALVGTKIKCPKCAKPFTVKLPDEEPEAEEPPRKVVRKSSSRADDEDDRDRDEPISKKRKRDDDDADDGDEEELPRKKKRRDDNGDAEDRPLRKKKKKKQKSSGLPMILIVGGSVAVVAAAVVLIVVLTRDGDSDKKTNGKPESIAKSSNDPRDNKQGNLAEPGLPADFSGEWPDPGGFFNSNPAPETIVTFRIIIAGDSSQKNPKGYQDNETAVRERLLAIVNTGSHVGASQDSPNGVDRYMTIRVAPVKESVAALAKRISFGKVLSVNDRVINLMVKKGEVPPSMPKK